MPSPVTEIATIVLKPDVSIGEGEATQIWQSTLNTVSKQPGFQKYYYGLQIENPKTLSLLVDWDDISSHQKFMKTTEYGPFLDDINKIRRELYLHHAATTPSPPSILSKAPVIEFATFHAIEDGFLENLNRFAQILKTAGSKEVPGYHDVAVAEVIEEIAKGGSDEGKAKAVHLWIGWDSVDAHMKFRESQLFKDNVNLFREKRGGVELFHATLKSS